MRKRPGFTLIELMIVVAVIGILASVALPRFAELIRRSKEGATKGNLGAMRGALSIYYSDMEGTYPIHLANLETKYLAVTPKVHTAPYHNESSGHAYSTGPAVSFDFGNWGYDNQPGDSSFGVVWIGCTHTDSKGVYWTTY